MKRYHYTACGLDYVYLINGYHVHETPYGSGVSIDNVDELHRAIADCIITGQQRIRGGELRFLRSMMDISQTRMGQILGLKRSRIAQIEGEPTAPLTSTADNLLRYRYAAFMKEHSVLRDLCDLLDEMEDSLEQKNVVMENEGGHWQCDEKIAA